MARLVVCSFKTLLDSIPPYWGPLRNDMLRKIGDVDNDVKVSTPWLEPLTSLYSRR